jgi:hypothetical protein
MSATGTQAKMGTKAVADWDTAYSAVDIQVPFTSETISPKFERSEDDSLVGTGSRGASVKSNEAVQGDTNHILDYNNFNSMVKAYFNDEAAGVFTINEALSECRYLEFDKVVDRWRFGPAKCTKLVISGAAGEFVKGAWTWVVKTLSRSSGAFPSISPSARNKLHFKNMLYFWIGDQGDALSASDKFDISSFELTLDRSLATDDYASGAGGGSGETQVLDPIENGWRTGALKLTFPRYSATTEAILDFKDGDTALQAVMLFQLGSESFKIELPNLRVADGFDVNVGGPELLRVEGTLSAHPSETGNPMYVGNECRITIV